MRVGFVATLCVVCSFVVVSAQTFVDRGQTVAIEAKRGVDKRVDYASLVKLGPWDDRNYTLTLEDLSYLAPNESEQLAAIPAFFRVEMRKAQPGMQRTGPGQYPRHAFPIFLQMFDGYTINGTKYRRAQRAGDRYVVELDPAATSLEPDAGQDFVSGEVRITTPVGAAESAIKINPVDPNKVVAGTIGPVTNQDMWYSTNGGSSWTRVSLPLGGSGGDPAVDWSSNGGFAYATTLGNCGFSGCQVWFYRSANGGQTWTSLESVTPGDPRREFGAGADKEYIHVDKAAGSPFKDRIYICWHQNNVQYFARSADSGNTFTTSSFPTTSDERGIGSDIATGPNGHVYYIWPGVNNRTMRVRKSTDGGVTFSATSTVIANTQDSYDFALPAMDSRRAFMYVAADADLGTGSFGGSVYAAWTDNTGPEQGAPSANHGRIQVARSRDGGATWAVSTPHSTTDQLTVDRFHPWIGVGSNGVVHVVYYDTRRDASRTSVDLFYAYSTDGAVTWSAPSRVTTVQSPKINDGFEWGDYNGLDIVLNNLIAIYTDNRNETGVGDSVDVYGVGITPGGAAVCGNSAIEAGEACDGSNLGGQTCATFSCTGGGTLSCNAGCTSVNTSACLGCPGTGAGTVPDGRFTPGPLLNVTKAAGSNITLTWGAACGAGSDYATYEGNLEASNSLQQRFCSSGGATTVTLAPSAANRYYLVTPLSGGNEGSYGKKSDGTERSPAATACVPQIVAVCP